MKVYYWAPFTSKVATATAVLNSAKSLDKYDKYEATIINSFGEWNELKKNKKYNKINFINLTNQKLHGIKNYFWSRVIFIKIFIFSFFKLKKILDNDKPNYLIIHLITSLPLVLFLIYKFETKLILRISGLPKLNLLRKFLWKISDKKIFLITTPTKSTFKDLKKKKIFSKKKIQYLPDPVFSNEIFRRKRKIRYKNYLLNIGRLTHQKNQKLLLKGFHKISKFNPKLKLIVLGEGERKKELKELCNKLNLNDKVMFLGHVNNNYEFIKNSVCVLVTSLWEDPGFVMIEAAALKKPVIVSNCPNGPKEFFTDKQKSFLFKNNSVDSLVKTFNKFKKTKKNQLDNIIKQNYTNSKKYSEKYHGIKLIKLLNEKE